MGHGSNLWSILRWPQVKNIDIQKIQDGQKKNSIKGVEYQSFALLFIFIQNL